MGHVVSKEGVSSDPEKINTVTEWPQPTTVTEVRSFLLLQGSQTPQQVTTELGGDTQSKEEVQGLLGARTAGSL